MRIDRTPFTINTPIVPYEPVEGKAIIAPLKKIKASATDTGNSTGFLGWFRRLIGADTIQPAEKKEEKLDPIPQDRIKQHMSQLKETNRHRKNLLDEAFDPLDLATEAGLERSWIVAQLDQIRLRKEETLTNAQEMELIQETIHKIKAEIEKKLDEKIKSGTLNTIFGRVDLASTALLIATTLVVSAAAFFSGGTIPAALLALQIAANVASGGSKAATSILKYNSEDLNATLFEKREMNQEAFKMLQRLMERNKAASEAVAKGYREARQIQEKRYQISLGDS